MLHCDNMARDIIAQEYPMAKNMNKDLESIDPSTKMDMDADKDSKPTPTQIIAPGGSQFAYSDHQMRVLGFSSIAEMVKAGFHVS